MCTSGYLFGWFCLSIVVSQHIHERASAYAGFFHAFSYAIFGYILFFLYTCSLRAFQQIRYACEILILTQVSANERSNQVLNRFHPNRGSIVPWFVIHGRSDLGNAQWCNLSVGSWPLSRWSGTATRQQTRQRPTIFQRFQRWEKKMKKGLVKVSEFHAISQTNELQNVNVLTTVGSSPK